MIKKISLPNSIQTIAKNIFIIRGQKILLDADLALLYGVTTKRLNEQVKRNMERFPPDFMFQLTTEEKSEVVAICDHLKNLKFAKTTPYAFTEHGAIMVAGILNTPFAIEMSVLVVRTFIELRQMVATNKDLGHKLAILEHRLEGHDETLKTLVAAVRQLMEPPTIKKKHPIGFTAWTTD